MNVVEGREKFINSWGSLGSSWGVSRTMAQVHALLLLAPACLSADEIMEELKISRGNANMNLRALMDWGLVHKKLKPGERKEFFHAEKDMWEVFRRILIQRKKKELEPMLKVLDEVSQVDGMCEHSSEFCKVVKDMQILSKRADSTLDRLIKTDGDSFIAKFMKMTR